MASGPDSIFKVSQFIWKQGCASAVFPGMIKTLEYKLLVNWYGCQCLYSVL